MSDENATGRRGKRLLTDIYQHCPVIHLDPEMCESCHFAIHEPNSYNEAYKAKEWQEAILNEINMIEKNHTYELVDSPKN